MKLWRLPPVTGRASSAAAPMLKHFVPPGARRGEAPPAPEIDAVLHEERLDGGRKRVHAISDPVAELPDGAVIVAAGEAYTIAHGRAFLWSEQDYQAARQIHRADGLLTPPSTLLAIRAGYRPVLHPDIEKIPISDPGCCRFTKATLAGAGLNGRDARRADHRERSFSAGAHRSSTTKW